MFAMNIFRRTGMIKQALIVTLLSVLLLSSSWPIALAQDTLVECPWRGGIGAVEFVNPVSEAKGKLGRNLLVRWDRIDERNDPPWFHRLRAVQLSFIWINKTDPANDYGKIVLDTMPIGTQTKGKYKLLSLEEPGFQKHRVSRTLAKKIYFTGYTYTLLCAE
ncbi:MAG: hypothetical protein OXF50_04180 [Caldilineaceae bacterium]|nr:hypothetical protein [Caldilineaceae bacterium]